MKMNKKLLMGMLTMSIMVMGLTGCGSSANSKSSKGEKADKAETKQNEKITMDQLVYEIKPEIEDGERYVMMKFTNNSKYLITSFEVDYKAKPDITKKQKDDFYSEIQKDLEIANDDMKELKKIEISMNATTEKLTDPGETQNKIYCCYFAGSSEMRNIEHFKLMKPDIVTIKYLDKGKIHTMYYDYTANSYSNEDETEAADQWTTKEIGKKMPKPKAKVIKAEEDEDDSFRFEAYGMNLDDFNSYVKECKSMGYTVDQSVYDGSYSANSKEGYSVDLRYDETSESISGTIERENQ